MTNKLIIIAEVGVNHNGKISLAKKLIRGASDAGADYVKFQFFKAKKLVSIGTNKANYQKKYDEKDDQYSMLKKLELSKADHLNLKAYAKKMKIKFLISAFDCEGLDFVQKLKLDYIKIPSGEITNVPYLKKVGSMNKKTILSTGMSSLVEIEFAIKLLCKHGLNKNNLTVLQCTTEYPAPIEKSNINAMSTIKKKFKVSVGYSDHTLGFESAIVASALGAEIIEKHITIDKKLVGPDHFASLDTRDFKIMVNMLKNSKLSLGSKYKKLSIQEKKNINVSRKKILALKIIKKGDIFNEKNLITLRSNKGISSLFWDQIIGKKSRENYKPYDPILIKL